jgi:hypothetical protein
MATQSDDTILVGCYVRRERVADALAALPGEDVLVAVRIPRRDIDAVTLAQLGAMGCLFEVEPLVVDVGPEG